MRALLLALALAAAPAVAGAADLTVVAPSGAVKVLGEADLAGLPRETVKLGAKAMRGRCCPTCCGPAACRSARGCMASRCGPQSVRAISMP